MCHLSPISISRGRTIYVLPSYFNFSFFSYLVWSLSATSRKSSLTWDPPAPAGRASPSGLLCPVQACGAHAVFSLPISPPTVCCTSPQKQLLTYRLVCVTPTNSHGRLPSSRRTGALPTRPLRSLAAGRSPPYRRPPCHLRGSGTEPRLLCQALSRTLPHAAKLYPLSSTCFWWSLALIAGTPGPLPPSAFPKLAPPRPQAVWGEDGGAHTHVRTAGLTTVAVGFCGASLSARHVTGHLQEGRPGTRLCNYMLPQFWLP